MGRTISVGENQHRRLTWDVTTASSVVSTRVGASSFRPMRKGDAGRQPRGLSDDDFHCCMISLSADGGVDDYNDGHKETLPARPS